MQSHYPPWCFSLEGDGLERGLICFRVDYRVKSRQGTSPFESLKDAKSAIRFIREHAEDLHVDPQRIVASGGSAGGHLAAATALVTSFNEGSDQLSYSSVPNALVLFNPVIDNGPGGYGYERIGEAYKDFSPLHNIREGAPPTIFFLGTQDKLIPVETARYYKTVMEKVGSRCDLSLLTFRSLRERVMAFLIMAILKTIKKQSQKPIGSLFPWDT